MFTNTTKMFIVEYECHKVFTLYFLKSGRFEIYKNEIVHNDIKSENNIG